MLVFTVTSLDQISIDLQTRAPIFWLWRVPVNIYWENFFEKVLTCSFGENRRSSCPFLDISKHHSPDISRVAKYIDLGYVPLEPALTCLRLGIRTVSIIILCGQLWTKWFSMGFWDFHVFKTAAWRTRRMVGTWKLCDICSFRCSIECWS